jgi:hypothetical protein
MKPYFITILSVCIFSSTILLATDFYFNAATDVQVAVSSQQIEDETQTDIYQAEQEVKLDLYRLTVHSLRKLSESETTISPQKGHAVYVMNLTVYNGGTHSLVPSLLVDNKLLIDGTYYGIKPYYPNIDDIFTSDIKPGRTETGNLILELPKSFETATLFYSNKGDEKDVAIVIRPD